MKSIPFALCLLAITGRLLAAEEVTVTIKTLAARMKYDTTEFTVSPAPGAVLRQSAAGPELLVPVLFKNGEARVEVTCVWNH